MRSNPMSFVASPEGGGPFRSRSRQDRHLCYVSPMGRGNARARAILPSAPCAPAGSQLEETIEEATISICGLRCELCIQGTYEDATSSDSRLGSLHCTTCGTEAPSLRGRPRRSPYEVCAVRFAGRVATRKQRMRTTVWASSTAPRAGRLSRRAGVPVRASASTSNTWRPTASSRHASFTTCQR